MFSSASSVTSARTTVSSSSTLFSRISTTWSDDSSTFSADFAHLAPMPAAPAPLPAAQKATSIHLPLRLPSPPSDLTDVDLESLVIDSMFEGKPVGFVVAKLRSIGAELLDISSKTCLHIPDSRDLPTHLPCEMPFHSTRDASPSSTVSYDSSASPEPRGVPTIELPPSHILAIRSNDSDRTLLVPVHGLLWASKSKALALVSSADAPVSPSWSQGAAGNPLTYLPVITLTLPSSLSFPLLQGWIYFSSPSVLLDALLPKPTARPSSPTSIPSLLNPTPLSLSSKLSELPSATILEKIQLVHGLWQNVMALEIRDAELWKVMESAWEILVGALALREKRRRIEKAQDTLTGI